jgi:hypothetical protein
MGANTVFTLSTLSMGPRISQWFRAGGCKGALIVSSPETLPLSLTISEKFHNWAPRSGGRVVSAAPTNGQAALDNSVLYSRNSLNRVGADAATGEIVVLSRTGARTDGDLGSLWKGKLGGEYHEHVRSWNELTPEMRNALKSAGLTDAKGRAR